MPSTNSTTLNSTNQIPPTTTPIVSTTATEDLDTTSGDGSIEQDQSTESALLSSSTTTPWTEPTKPTVTITTEARGTNTTTSSVITGCPRGDKKDCDDISGYECYNHDTRDECCETCEDFRENITGCQFGDRISNCFPNKPWLCYNNSHRQDCCQTCNDFYVDVAGCEYGDKISNCEASQCSTYSQGRKNDCCDTCFYDPTTTTQAAERRSGGSDDPPEFLIPLIGAVGGILLILLIVFMYLWWRRRKQAPERLSPIDEKMYNDYKLSKRAPMALPRDLDEPTKPSLTRSDSAEYAYINPEDVATEGDGRKSDVESQPARSNGPIEYLELGNADKYGYLEPLGTTIKNGDVQTNGGTDVQYKNSQANTQQNTQDTGDNRVQYQNEQAIPHRLNTYQKFPADGTPITSPASEADQSQSVKL